MRAASWQVDALGRGRYKRYDERTATMLGEGAELLDQRWPGDLRKLHAGAPATVLPRCSPHSSGSGPAGADIFLREVQGV
jgi:hypothetical protein